MALLAELYGAFGLFYSVALIILKHVHFSNADKAFLAAALAFFLLSLGSFVKKLCAIPSGYRCTFTCKSVSRGLVPLFSLFMHPILFCRSRCVRRAFTFSNEAYDGVERTRQLVIYELGWPQDGARFLTTHSLLWDKKKKVWGYKRLVGEIWVTVEFKAPDFPYVDISKTLQTSEFDTEFLLQYQRDTKTKSNAKPIHSFNLSAANSCSVPGTSNAANQVRRPKASCCCCCFCECSDPEGGLEFLPPSSATNLPDAGSQYAVTITRKFWRCTLGCSWVWSSDEVRHWTLLQIHQYMVCLDVWGNHPKQGIWKNDQATSSSRNTSCCLGNSSCCSGNTNTGRNQAPKELLYKYCYRHDELTEAIHNNMRLTSRENKGTWYTVV